MTEIEEKFMKVFGIKNITNGCEEYYYIPNEIPCKECEDKICLKDPKYSVITNRILLELICILAKNMEIYSIKDTNISDLKSNILHRAINLKEIIKQDVKALFESEV